MGKLLDLTGKHFGRLTVIDRAINEGKEVQWNCICECGNKCIVKRRDLQTGHTMSCGCLRKENIIKNNKKLKMKDLTNRKFGMLTAIEPLNTRDYGCIVWKCKCDCGAFTNIRGTLLTQGLIQSCGCQKSKGELFIKNWLFKNNIPFEQEKTFDTCRFPDTNFLARFDFYIDNSFIIEYDGIQHFIDNDKWKNLEYIKKHDKYKNDWCKNNNIPLYRINYKENIETKLNEIFKNEKK